MQFNLSHSQGLGLLAVSGEHRLGVDVEALRESVDYANIARRFFAPAEVEELLALPIEQQPQAFFTCWTRKEAYIKGLGQGLAVPLDRFTVSLTPGQPPRLSDSAGTGDWRLFEIEPGGGFIAALAVEGAVAGIRCWDWPP